MGLGLGLERRDWMKKPPPFRYRGGGFFSFFFVSFAFFSLISSFQVVREGRNETKLNSNGNSLLAHAAQSDKMECQDVKFGFCQGRVRWRDLAGLNECDAK